MVAGTTPAGDLAGELVLDEYRDQLDQAQQLLTIGDTDAAIEVLCAVRPTPRR